MAAFPTGLRSILPRSSPLVTVWAAFVVWVPGASGQILNFRSYGARQGLPQAQVMAVVQDTFGYLWLGTYGGLTRFDGRAFSTLTVADGLTANAVVDLVEAEPGVLAVGTLGGGVCFVEEGRVERCLGAADGLTHDDVRALEVGAEGTLWVSTDRGVTRVVGRRAVRSFGPEDGLPPGEVRDLAVGGDGRLWVATTAGLAVLEGTRLDVRAVPFGAGVSVSAVHPSANGVLAATSLGVFRVTEADAERLPLDPAGLVTDFATDDAGTLWVATLAGVLRSVGTEVRGFTESEGLVEDEVNRVVVDREGTVWFGTENGLGQLVPGPFAVFTESEGLPNPFVRALLFHEGTLWVGTRSGLARWDGARFTPVPLASRGGGPRVYALRGAPGGGILVATTDGLFHLRDGVTRHFGVDQGLPHTFVTSLAHDGRGGVWVGTGGGLARWVGGTIDAEAVEVLPDFVISLLDARDGETWVGLRAGGLAVLDGGAVRRIGRSEGLTDQTVWALAREADGHVWAGTNGDGAFRVGADGIQRLDRLSNDFVWQVQVDARGAVWFFTSRGLERLEDGALRRYGTGHGLPDLEGTAGASVEDGAGNLWFGSGVGVYRYVPRLDVPDLHPPGVRIEALETATGPLPLQGAGVPARSGMLRVRFSSPAYRAPARFRWRLAGSDSTWSPPSDDAAVTLAGLSPGAYTLEVVAENEDGLASSEAATASFEVLPAWWETWWARALAALLVAALVASFPALRARRLARERRQLNDLVGRRTRELHVKTLRLEAEVGERRAAEAALRVSERRVRDILDHSTNLFFSRSADGVLTFVSPCAPTFFGVDAERALVPWDDLLTDDPVNETGREAGLRALETGVAQPPYDLQLRHPTRGHVWVRVNEAPVVRDGVPVAVVGSLTDVTDAREGEAARARLEGELRQAQKMEAVGRLAGGIAHDFNNLLTSVLGNADLAMHELDDGHPALDDLDEIRRSAERGAALVSQLLTFGRRQIVLTRLVDLGEAVTEAARLLRRLIGSNVELTLDLPPKPVLTRVDSNQLDQVLVNLAINARDAIHPRSGAIRVAVRREEVVRPLTEHGPDVVAQGSYAVLEVGDDGMGMDQVTLQHAFEPFFTTKAVGEGTGLGLSTVYGVTKQHRGYIQVRSGAGQGTTFALYFPIAAEADEPVDRPAGLSGETERPDPRARARALQPLAHLD